MSDTLEEARDTLESKDPYADVRNGLRVIAKAGDEWAGIPIPIKDGPRLIIEPRHRLADGIENLNNEFAEKPEPDPDGENVADDLLRSTFYSHKLRSIVGIFWNPKTEMLRYGIIPKIHHFRQDLETMGASVVWGIEQEARAIRLLARLLPHHAFKKYMLTGMFIERSPRSGLVYMFRRLKPTVAISFRNKQGEEDGGTRILAALCMHPIAYYDGTWAGAMCPTDDVIAHLMLMRGDEVMFWRRCNQHPPHMPEAGL
jgi:hypothetical protein